MNLPALLQMSTRDPMFWIMVIIAASFILIAVAMIAIAVYVSRAVKTVNRLEEKRKTEMSGRIEAAPNYGEKSN